MSEWMSEEIEEKIEEEQEVSRFEVTDNEKAEWCLEKIREHKAEIDKWSQYYEAEKKRTLMVHENAIFKLETMLKGFFFQQDDKGLTRETKTMTVYNLPTGRIFMKRQEPEYEKDEEQMLGWLRENAPDFIKTKETVDWSGMKAAYAFDVEGNMVHVDEETGEIIKIPGVKAKTREDVFKVDVKEAK